MYTIHSFKKYGGNTVDVVLDIHGKFRCLGSSKPIRFETKKLANLFLKKTNLEGYIKGPRGGMYLVKK